jgi:energy-converting hydrogenase Eha subunit E
VYMIGVSVIFAAHETIMNMITYVASVGVLAENSGSRNGL